MIVYDLLKTSRDGIKIYKIYSDQNTYILKNGTKETYAVAIETENSFSQYEDTGIPIPIQKSPTHLRQER